MIRLTDYLERIGQEAHDLPYMDGENTIRIRTMTKDEALAREVWRRALGYEEETESADGNMSHLVVPPDPKMQMFIFERREGKNVQPPDEKGAALLDKISDLVASQTNEMAEQAVDDRDDNTPEA